MGWDAVATTAGSMKRVDLDGATVTGDGCAEVIVKSSAANKAMRYVKNIKLHDACTNEMALAL